MAKQGNKRFVTWGLWAMLSLALGGIIAAAVAGIGEPRPGPVQLGLRALLLPGQTTHGHHQIELACKACHTKAFPGREDVQESCEGCHAAALKEAHDSHPRSKFTDPRNADRAALLDATWCVTCHVEHKPGITLAGGVTLPKDYCVVCHKDVAKDRPSHKGMAFNTCTDSGCHSYHDNTALYEDFLVKHAGSGFMNAEPRVAPRDFREVAEELGDYPFDRYPLQALAATDADHAGRLRSDPTIDKDWLGTAHAAAGVNCSACHQPGRAGRRPGEQGKAWVEKPDQTVCASCHKPEVDGFLGGLHGMRIKQGLPPMTPADARLPMNKDASHTALGCTTCHTAHRFETREAAVDACLGCHADEHSLAYRGSAHERSWLDELRGEAPAGSGVSCATCHMLRIEFRTPDYVKRTLVQHNQSANLVPPSKMARSVCLSCHGLGASLDALADPALMKRNFKGRPSVHVASITMAVEREQAIARKRAEAGDDAPTDD